MTVNYAIDPALTECEHCPDWQVPCMSEAEKDRREAAHAHAKHGDPMPAQPVVGAGWQEQAADAVRQVAARGQDFTIYEALREFGLADPPNAKNALGRFSVLIHDMHVAHPVRYDASSRPGTKRSAAGVWNRNQARCTNKDCRAKVGVA